MRRCHTGVAAWASVRHSVGQRAMLRCRACDIAWRVMRYSVVHRAAWPVRLEGPHVCDDLGGESGVSVLDVGFAP